MSRPATRRFVHLPTLEPRRPELETCAFCPKLCRTACPVSNAEPNETLIPWGKMTGVYSMAMRDLEATKENAAPTWACTGCLACREKCDHHNPVADTLVEGRVALAELGLAPETTRRVIREHEAREHETRDAARRLDGDRVGHGTLLLIGCTYLRKLPETAASAVRIAEAIWGAPRVYDGCCGLPLLLAGDARGFHLRSERLARTADSFGRVAVVDPGCARAARDVLGDKMELLVSAADRALDRFERGVATVTRARYHDPCSLGRGLGIYDAPRRVLAHAMGVAPAEFEAARERAVCSGAGGLLPSTMPEVSAAIAAARLAEPSREPGEDLPIVTACASSLLAFRRAGKVAYDLCDVLAPTTRATSPSQ